MPTNSASATEEPGPPPRRAEPVVIEFSGHPSVRATDPRGWEILDTDEWADRPGALGFLPRFDAAALRGVRGRVHVRLEVGGTVELLEATLWPGWTRGLPFAFRRDTRTAAKPYAMQCSKAATDLDKGLIEALRLPKAEGRLFLTPLAGSIPVPGSLTLVAMPIGHQGDLPPRAIDVLMESDMILAEDTREAEQALRWRGIRTPIISCHEHNERSRLPEVVRRLRLGQRLALVSDAGTPLVSDPGYPLVQSALEAGAHVTAIPGPSAIIQALVLSGLPTDTFRFAGFAPRRATEMASFVAEVLESPDTSIVFESSHRIMAFTEAVCAAAPIRPMAMCKDLTKRTEEILRGTTSQVADRLRQMTDQGGEYCVVLAPKPPDTETPLSGGSVGISDANILAQFISALLAAGCPTAPIAKAWRETAGLARDDAYARVQQLAKNIRGGAEPGRSG